MGGDVTVRLATKEDDFRAFQQVQQAAWGDTDLQTIPSHLFLAAAEKDNVHGAFDSEGNVVGFTYTMQERETDTGEKCETDSGQECETAYIHMIGVDPEHEGGGIGERLLRENQRHWKSEGFSKMTLTFDPLQGANASLYFKDAYEHLGWAHVFHPDYYPDEENAHRFEMEYPFETSGPEELRNRHGDPTTLLAVGDDGTVDRERSLVAFDEEDGRWTLPADPPETVAVEFPWDVERLSRNHRGPDGDWETVEAQWLSAIQDVFVDLLSRSETGSDTSGEYAVVDMRPHEKDRPYGSDLNWGAANRYVLAEQE